MFINENSWRSSIPLYEVKEISLEEALLVLAAEKEQLRNALSFVPSVGSAGSLQGEPSRAVA